MLRQALKSLSQVVPQRQQRRISLSLFDSAWAIVGIGPLAGEAALGGVGLVHVKHAVVRTLEEEPNGGRRSWSPATQAVARAVAESDDHVLRLTKLCLKRLDQARLAALLLAVGCEALLAVKDVGPEDVGSGCVGVEGNNVRPESDWIERASRWLL